MFSISFASGMILHHICCCIKTLLLILYQSLDCLLIEIPFCGAQLAPFVIIGFVWFVFRKLEYSIYECCVMGTVLLAYSFV